MTDKLINQFKKLDDIEHALLRPGYLIGSTTNQQVKHFVLNLETNKMEYKELTYTPGLLQIFNEVITNSVDEHTRNKVLNQIKVKINTELNEITIWDNGGIPVLEHPEHKEYIPEMVFSNLKAGSNFNDEDERFLAGQNGVGSTCTNIFSSKFSVTTADGKNQFYQLYENNLSKRTTPVIKKSNKNFTEIKFIPDFTRFDTKGIDSDLIHLIRKRIIDISATNLQLKLSLQVDNNEEEKYYFKTFKEFTSLFVNDVIYEQSDRWQIGVGLSSKKFQQVSYVNTLETTDEGTHIDYIVRQITDYISTQIKKKYKVDVNPYQIKQHLFLFVSCLIDKPAFHSQTKTKLITKQSDFKSTHVLSESFLKKLFNSEIIESVVYYAQKKLEADTERTLQIEHKKLSRTKIEGLVDAKSTDRSKCELGLYEGKSAMSSFRTYRNPQLHAAYPLRGKIQNVKKIKDKLKIIDNNELKNLIGAIGLKIGEKPTNLRYGKILLFTDADTDGDSISALLINFFHEFWPELFDMGIIHKVLTPILVAKNKKKTINFYSELEYENWLLENPNHTYSISYKKGLAALEGKEYSDMIKNPKLIQLVRDKQSNELLEIWFGNDTEKRKKIISQTELKKLVYGDSTERFISEFLNTEYLSYAYYVIEQRAIPSVIDGFKPTQRKIINESTRLWKNNRTPLKVFVYSGYVTANNNYHHGNSSMEGAIVGMAQKFKNNLPLLEEVGQFGQLRIPEAGAARYIGTTLTDNFNLVYKDNNLVTYKFDEGKKIEPFYFLPIIPTVLINGSSGMAVGHATNVINKNPLHIIQYCLNYLKKESLDKIKILPKINGFNGKVYNDKSNKLRWVFEGKYEIVNTNTIHISELPFNLTFEQYEKHLDNLIVKKHIIDYDDNSSDTPDYTIKLTREKLSSLQNEDIIKLFNLRSYDTDNLTVLDEFGKLKIFSNVEELINYFVEFRLTIYDIRKSELLSKNTKTQLELNNKINFVEGIINNKIEVYKKTKIQIGNKLIELKFDLIDDSYNYLLNMPIHSFSKDTLNDLKDKLKDVNKVIKELKNTKSIDMYIKDLEELKSKL